MATRYWVGGSGTWDGFTSTNWSATSGGAGGAGVPTDNDSVIFNSASSGASYVVQCDGNGRCGQITTSAPAAGTLTFSTTVSGGVTLFTAEVTSITQTINIHAACLFSPSALYNYVYINLRNFAATATTVTFNGSGTNTQRLAIGVVATGNVTFCTAQTCTFTDVSIVMDGNNLGAIGTFTCAGSNITINAGIYVGGSLTGFKVVQATTVNMAATNLVVGSLTAGLLFPYIEIDAGSTPTWSIAGLNITMRTDNSVSVSSNGNIKIGPNANTVTPTIGSVTIEGLTTSASTSTIEMYISRCTTLTVRDVIVNAYSGSSDYSFGASGAVAISTTLGSVATTAFNMLGYFSTVTFGSTFTVTGLSTNYASAAVAGNTSATLASLSVTDGTFSPNGVVTISGATTLTRGNISTTIGPGYSLTTGDITGTGQTATAGLINSIQVDTLLCSSLTLTNTSLISNATVTINGGVGKTFSFTTNASAPVLGDYPNIRVGALTVSTPTMSIVGTVTKRVVCSYGATSIWTITPVPTLQYVTFIKTQVNFGVSNYTGTAIGTDGLSVGVVGQAVRSLYCVAVGTQNFDTAIWATTPGGVGSTANYPLPQDTIIFTTAIVSAGNITLLSPSISLYLGSVTVEASTNIVSIAEDSTGSTTSMFGNLYTSTTATTYIGKGVSVNATAVVMAPSGATTRYVSGNWSMGEGFYGTPGLGFNGSFSISADDTNPTYNFSSGTLSTTSLQIPTALGGSLSVNTDGLTSITCPTLNIFLGNINFSTTAISATTVTFTNSSPSLVMEDTPYTLILGGGFYPSDPAKYTNNGGWYRGGLVVLEDSTSFFTNAYFQLDSLNVRRLTLLSNGALGTTRTITFDTNATVKDFATAGSVVSWGMASSGGVRTITKTGGGRVQLTGNLASDRVSASPANTFYVSGTLSQTNGATGWVQGIAPSNNGGFLFF
jgi:hypothetical protein